MVRQVRPTERKYALSHPKTETAIVLYQLTFSHSTKFPFQVTIDSNQIKDWNFKHIDIFLKSERIIAFINDILEFHAA